MTNVEQHQELLNELHQLYEKKNRDYGDSFHQTFLEEEFAMSRIRLTDKLLRFKRLSMSGEQNIHDESIRDTLMDLANYAIMTVMEIDRYQKEAAESPSEITNKMTKLRPYYAVTDGCIGVLGRTNCDRNCHD